MEIFEPGRFETVRRNHVAISFGMEIDNFSVFTRLDDFAFMRIKYYHTLPLVNA